MRISLAAAATAFALVATVSSAQEPKLPSGLLTVPLTEQTNWQILQYSKLFELAPKGSGISRIHFFNVGMDDAQVGRQRQHPLSDLLMEKVVAVPRPDGRFDFAYSLERPLETIAVWLSSDGDDTGSKFTVLVEQIELQGH